MRKTKHLHHNITQNTSNFNNKLQYYHSISMAKY